MTGLFLPVEGTPRTRWDKSFIMSSCRSAVLCLLISVFVPRIIQAINTCNLSPLPNEMEAACVARIQTAQKAALHAVFMKAYGHVPRKRSGLTWLPR